MILIAYDGSPDAKAAIQRGASLFPGQRAVVLTAWQRFGETMAAAGVGLGGAPTLMNLEEVDRATEEASRARAEEGAQLARGAGIQAEPRVVAIARTAAESILNEAARLEADAIVMGSRGLTGLKSLILGSVSHAVLSHADRPVVVVPSAELALARGRHLQELTQA